MFASVLRAAARPAVRAARVSFKPARAFSVTARASSGGPPPPQLYGTGAQPGTVPTDIEQATGLERLQLLGELEGVSVFDDQPLDSSRLGTKADPVLVLSYDAERLVGCSGVPADSHEVLWFELKKDKLGRCTECGSVYKMDFQGEEHEHDGHHH